MTQNIYNAFNLIGGTDVSLDGIDGSSLAENDFAITFTSTVTYIHRLDSTSGAAESSPDVIAPDTNPSTKRWVLVEMYVGNIDHGNLTGLGDDDHTQYLLRTDFTTSSGDIITYVDDHTWTESDITDLDKYTQAEVDSISGALSSEIDSDIITFSGTIDHDTIVNTHNLTTDIDHDQLTNTHNLTTDIDHDQLTNYSADEHFTWATVSATIDHDTIVNNHNLTTDIDHDQLTNTHNLTTDIDHNQLTNYFIEEHRIINDAGISGTELWSSEQIENRIVTATGSLTQDHGSLLGLDDDDHSQYLLADGTRQLTGDWDFGSQVISGTGDVSVGGLETRDTVVFNADFLDSVDVIANGDFFGTPIEVFRIVGALGRAQFPFGDVAIGTQDVFPGVISLKGSATSSTSGGRVTLNTAFDYSGIVESYGIQAHEQYLKIGSGSNADRFARIIDTLIEFNPDDEDIDYEFGTASGHALTINGETAFVTLLSGASINEFSTDGTMSDNSDTAVPTEQAVKTYVDTEITTATGSLTVNHSELNELDWASAGHTGLTAADVIYDGSETVEDILDRTINNGVIGAITVTTPGGLTIDWTAGEIFDSVTNTVISTLSGTDILTNNAINYLKWTSGTSLTLGTTAADALNGEISVAHIAVQDGVIYNIHEVPVIDKRESTVVEALSGMLPVVVTTGLVVSENNDVTYALDVQSSAGTFYHRGHIKHDVSAITSISTPLVRHFKTGGVWDSDTNEQIDTSQYNDGTDLSAALTKWYKSVFIVSPNALHWIYPTVQYNNIGQALVAPLPTIPPGLASYPTSTALVYQGGASSLPAAGSNNWIDVRPVIGASSTSSPISDHGNLSGLEDDDHPQYLLADGSRHADTLIVDGDFIVSGTQFIASTETVLIEDNLLVINNGEIGAGVTEGVAGIEVDRGSETNYLFYFDETDDNFQIGVSGSLQPVATRLDSSEMTASGIPYWDGDDFRFETVGGFILTGGNARVPAAAPLNVADLTRKDYVDGLVTVTSGVIVSLGVQHVFSQGTENLVGGTSAGENLEGSTTLNILLGNGAGNSITTGSWNTCVGGNAGVSITTGASNTCIGIGAGNNITTGSFNVFIGDGASSGGSGNENTSIGIYAGSNLVTGSGNVNIGAEAGYASDGSYNVFIGRRAGWGELGSNKLYIENSDSTTPLIYGDFATRRVGINKTTLTESLTVSGAINIGTTATTNSGTIRYTGSDFEGYHGGEWKSLTGGGINNVSEDNTPALGGHLNFNGYSMEHTSILSGDATYQGEIITVTVDDASTVSGNVLYQAADFNFERADADAAGTGVVLALALESGNGSKKVMLRGQYCETDWDWSAGLVYLSATTGEMVQTPPSSTGQQVVICGFALSPDTIYFNPQYGVAQVA